MNESTKGPLLRRSKETMYPLIEAYLSRGQSQADFCRSHQIKLCTFQYWLRKYRKWSASSGGSADKGSGFVRLDVGSPSGGHYALELRTADGGQLSFGELPPVPYLKALLC